MAITFAQRLFEIQRQSNVIETETLKNIERIIKMTYDGEGYCEDYRADPYDRSIELFDCAISTLTEEQKQEFWKLGFACMWVHKDGLEVHYCKPKT